MPKLTRAQLQKIERDQARRQKEAAKRKAKQLVLDDYSTREVGKMVGADPSTVSRWTRQEIRQVQQQRKNAQPKPHAKKPAAKPKPATKRKPGVTPRLSQKELELDRKRNADLKAAQRDNRWWGR
jgi:transposase